MDYHQMTMNEPRDSPAKRQQFLVICAVMVSSLLYTAITSGAFITIEATSTEVVPFPGGTFCYKLGQRDYAVSEGIGRSIQDEWKDSTMGKPMPTGSVSCKVSNDDNNNDGQMEVCLAETNPDSDQDEGHERKKLVGKRLYHVYLDDPTILSATQTRWMTGLLVSDAEMDDYCGPLLANNPKIEKVAKLSKKKGVEINDLKPMEFFAQTRYELMDLPSVNSLVVQFPFTNGFVSALLFNYKVIPQIRRLAASRCQEGNELVVISHCSPEQEMCTHYVPLSRGIEFLGGQPTMEEHRLKYANDSQNMFTIDQFIGGVHKISRYLKKALGISS